MKAKLDAASEVILNDVQKFVAIIEESGLRTRKEIKEMLTARGVNKFTELEHGSLVDIRDELEVIAGVLED